MPRTIQRTDSSGGDGLMDVKAISKNDPYKYDYPDKLDLRPSSKLHQTIRDAVIFRARGAQDALSKRFEGWKEIDRTLTSYIRTDDLEDKIKDQDDRKPVRIVVPTSYATLDTLLTYLVAAFLEEPYFRYSGGGPEDTLGAILLEMIVAQQCRKAKAGLEMHTMWRDSLAYGFGVVHVGWETRSAYRTITAEETMYSRLRNTLIGSGNKSSRVERVTIYEGSTLTALDPYMCLLDPNTPIHDVQRSEFFGWIEDTNLMELMESERDNEYYFNAKYVKHIPGESQFNARGLTARGDKTGGGEDRRTDVSRPVDVIHMYMRIIPKDVGLGDEEYPEWWLFEVAGDQIVVRAQPLGLDHGMLPIAVTAPDFDGHSMTPISRLEVVYGLQQTMDWLLDSHVANVRKAINDMLVVDPMLVNYHDVANPKPGKIIRMRRQAWGRGVKDAVMQLAVSDVTKGHIQDSAYITDIIKFVTGAQDAISGIRRNTSERVSATEAADVKSGALSRLEKFAKIASLQSHYDIALQMAWNTRQLMETETYAKILGDWEQTLKEDMGIDTKGGLVKVSPKDLDIDFDVIPHDGSIPSNGNPGIWMQLMQVITGNPYLLQQFDVVRMFKFGARLAGAKNLNDFVKKGGNVQTRVMPDQQVAAGAASGKLQPMPAEPTPGM